ncbi:hypothetical protein SAMN02745885_00576 [Carboxydocella sporoproducens DSM 16521]|uniref:Uncharacterized protein n=3 Tax=Carboxydocella TaxID=178898 RepID=A0A1T4MHH5_9FIRM|nr:hypothetical protein [Carboxydocella sporoproducens]AVX21331.1 hypothetical protein CFE_2168 [Carboxydocella thermautotrophica]SJZ66325.1 hypothetical protein SAMN02745885_00576 [Carboxydocella sporoproducens DSM 16521]
MSLSFIKYKKPSSNPVIQQITEEIKNNLILLRYISRIFAIYSINDNANLEEIDRYISDTINNPALTLCSEKKNKIIDLIKNIYRSLNFEKIRSEILENIVYELGPFKINHAINAFLEPRIMDGEVIIGNSDHRCDVVFYNNDTSPLEILECKTNINNSIPSNMPFERIKDKIKNQILYMVNVYNYLKEHYCEPAIFIACYNVDYKKAQKNLNENWGYAFLKCIGPEDIIRISLYKKTYKKEEVLNYVD